MKTEVRPTLWRTCRALANMQRLQMMMLLNDAGAMGVSRMAQEMECTTGEASEALRILNARGLLRVRRLGRNVYYVIGANTSISWTSPLLHAVMEELKSGRDGRECAFKALTGLTHYRRHRILYELSLEDMDLARLRARTGISKSALQRHLRKLCMRGLVTQKKASYCRARPRNILKKTLLSLSSNPP